MADDATAAAAAAAAAAALPLPRGGEHAAPAGCLDVLLTTCRVLWFHLLRLVFGDVLQLVPPRGQRSHLAVVVGDDTAEGLGDYTVLGVSPGVAGRVEPLVRREPRLRHRWTFLNRGYTGSTSADWLPDAAGPPPLRRVRRVLCRRRRNLWTHCVERDAEIAVLALGRNDHRAGLTAEQTATNVLRVAEYLHAAGAHTVLVCPLPLPTDSLSPEYLPNRTRNELIRRALAAQPEGSALRAGPDLAGPPFLGDEMYLPGGHHFSSSGHKAFARQLLETALPHMVRREFLRWRPVLTGGK